MSEPTKNVKIINAIFKQNYAQKLLIAFKMVYYCCFCLRGNLDFTEFPPKSFITSTTGFLPSMPKLYLQIFKMGHFVPIILYCFLFYTYS